MRGLAERRYKPIDLLIENQHVQNFGLRFLLKMVSFVLKRTKNFCSFNSSDYYFLGADIFSIAIV